MVEKSRQFLKYVFCYDATKLKKMAKFCVPAWTLFAGPVTYVCKICDWNLPVMSSLWLVLTYQENPTCTSYIYNTTIKISNNVIASYIKNLEKTG